MARRSSNHVYVVKAIKLPKAGMWVGPLKIGLILKSEFTVMITFIIMRLSVLIFFSLA